MLEEAKPAREYNIPTFEQFIERYRKQVGNDDNELEYVIPEDVVLDGWRYYSQQITNKGMDILVSCLVDIYCNFFMFYDKTPDDSKTVKDALALESMYNMIVSLGLESRVSMQLEVYRRKNI